MNENKIRFKQLSTSLQVIVTFSWFLFAVFIVSFISELIR